MIPPRLVPLVCKHVVRQRTRTLLTAGGVCTAMFLFYTVSAMHEGVRAATQATGRETTLVVYRQDRYCPYSSNLPEDYARKIAEIPGVSRVVPVRIAVSNCRTSLDVVTFRGVPADTFDDAPPWRWQLVAGSLEEWKRRSDAAIVGQRLAKRRNLSVGSALRVADITVTIAGILASEQPQDQNVAYTHLAFLQRAAGNKVGTVTQFNVTVDDPVRMDEVAAQIDATFQHAAEPTHTWPEKAFVARTAKDILEIVQFARWLGWGCLVAVFALVANAIVLSVQDRIRDHAVLQTLGFPCGLLARLIVAEGLLVCLAGGAAGLGIGLLATHVGQWSLSVEGYSVHIQAGPAVVLTGLLLCTGIGVAAGTLPAWQAARRPIVSCFRAV